MNQPVVFMYSGQGSHYLGMGKELYHKNHRFKFWMDHCDNISRDVGGFSFIDYFYGDGFKCSTISNPAFSAAGIIGIQYSLSKLLIEKGIYPDALLGYSLGETTSAIIAESISLENGLNFAIRHSNVLKNGSPLARLIAVIDDMKAYDFRKDIYDGCWLAATNFSRNFVVGGDIQSMQKVESRLKGSRIVYQVLPTTIGYHTPLINELENKFKETMDGYQWAPAKIEMVSSQNGSSRFRTSTDHFWKVIRQPVEFFQTVRSLISKSGGLFVDVGPSGSLAACVKYSVDRDESVVSCELMNRFGKNVFTFDQFIRLYKRSSGSLG